MADEPDISTDIFEVIDGPEEISHLPFQVIIRDGNALLFQRRSGENFAILPYTNHGGNLQVGNTETGSFVDVFLPSAVNGRGFGHFYRFSFDDDYTPEWVRGPYKIPIPWGLQPTEKGSDLDFHRADHHDAVNAAAVRARTARGFGCAPLAHQGLPDGVVRFVPTLALPRVAIPVNVPQAPQFFSSPQVIGTQAAPVNASPPAPVNAAQPPTAVAPAPTTAQHQAPPPNAFASDQKINLGPGFARDVDDDFYQGMLDLWQPIAFPAPHWLVPTNGKRWTAAEILLIVYEEKRGQHRVIAGSSPINNRPWWFVYRFREWGFTRNKNSIDHIRSRLNRNGWFGNGALLRQADELVGRGQDPGGIASRRARTGVFNNEARLVDHTDFWE
ncbi:hypothetical protein GE09DRAFT_1067358 [Coniochaeta sp. 2T2.1]|nr:hypothetical protein GE09DRAFT_1067358 [Coniochaeta sp. 2T2.1]